MAKKWEQMTKNQKLDLLRAELAKLMRHLAEVERSKAKKPKPKVKKVSKKEVQPTPAEPSVPQAAE